MSNGGEFIWNELITHDQKTSGKFYSELFGWQRKEVDAGPLGVYTMFQRDGKDVAGMMNPTIEYTQKLGPRWYAYVAVGDVDETAARAVDLGGTIIAGPEDIPGVGRLCLLADPTGAPIRLMKPAEGSR